MQLVRGDEVIVDRLQIADRMWSRMRGLLGRSSLAAGSGLWITPCSSIHMWGMRFPIDVVFVDRDMVVVKVRSGLAPWKLMRGGRGAATVFELPCGAIDAARLAVGDRLALRDAPPRLTVVDGNFSDSRGRTDGMDAPAVRPDTAEASRSASR